MSQKPQRPFVPHRTPTSPRPAITTSEFRLSPPFVPGSGRDIGAPMPQSDAAIITESEPVAPVSLRSIDDFLDTSPTQVAAYAQDTSEDPYGAEFDDEPDELPPVEHFIDELPAVERFAPEGEGRRAAAASPEPDRARAARRGGWRPTGSTTIGARRRRWETRRTTKRLPRGRPRIGVERCRRRETCERPRHTPSPRRSMRLPGESEKGTWRFPQGR